MPHHVQQRVTDAEHNRLQPGWLLVSLPPRNALPYAVHVYDEVTPYSDLIHVCALAGQRTAPHKIDLPGDMSQLVVYPVVTHMVYQHHIVRVQGNSSVIHVALIQRRHMMPDAVILPGDRIPAMGANDFPLFIDSLYLERCQQSSPLF